MHFLLVDDESIVHETLRAFMHHLGHTSESANNGINGQQALLKKHYDAAFVDIRMPGMDGISLLKWCRDAQPHLAVVIMTGHGADVAREMAMRCGAYAFIEKPFSLRKIKQLIKNIEARPK